MGSSPKRPRCRFLPLLLVFILPIASSDTRAMPLFPGPVYPVGSYPFSIVSADFNQDGRPDLITVNYLSNDLSILLSREGGDFSPETRLTVAPHPAAAAVGDFNGDGSPDLATCSGGGLSNLTLLLGRGDGTFETAAFISSPGDCSDIVVADFNNDHKADLAMLSVSSGIVTVRLGNGDGTFGPESGGSTGALELAVTMAVGDFNRDGNPDIVVGSREAEDLTQARPGIISVLLGAGDGTFAYPQWISTRRGVLDLVVADLNQDNNPDVAMSDSGGGFVYIYPGRGDGTFLDPGSASTEQRLFTLIAGDFNSDGRVDLAGTNRSSGFVFVLPGRGDGTFDPKLQSVTVSNPISLVTADFDADGRIDVATASYFQSNVVVLSGHGDGNFGPQMRAATGMGPRSMAAGDFNRDGKPDLATGNFTSGDVSILPGLGEGRFDPQVRYAAGSNPMAVVVADFDGDGIQDLAAANLSSKDISVRLGLGDGSFGSENRIALQRRLFALVSGDFNRDGKADLAAASPDDLGEILILIGLGDGFFAPPLSVQYRGAQFLAVDDFNRDGIPDLAAVAYLDIHVAVLLGQGDGTFTPPLPPSPGNGTTTFGLTAGDLDGDGIPDAVLTTGGFSGPWQVLYFRGRGDGTFDPATAIPCAPAAPSAVVIGDFDLDRRNDLAVAESVNDLIILRNLGGGVFAPAERYLAGSGPSALLALDLNGDGWSDLVSANSSTNDVLVLMSGGIPEVLPNRPPVADAGADATHECAPPPGTSVLLNGSGSSDPDSTPGTADDIVLYEWFEEYGGPSQALLGTGATLAVTLQLGVHTITLEVTDAAGASATDTLTITVADATPPFLSVTVSPSVLWPPNGRMADILATVSGGDLCTPPVVVLESILVSDSTRGTKGAGPENGDIQGAEFGTTDFQFSLRAWRPGGVPGRTYTITYRSTDGSGNVARGAATVFVPHDLARGAPGSSRPARSWRRQGVQDLQRLPDPAP